MDKFIIDGGNKLFGTVSIESAKNSVLPLLAASVLTDEQVIIRCVPAISDVENMLRILLARGFDGWFSIEEAGFQGVDGMKRAIANTHQLYQAALPKNKA